MGDGMVTCAGHGNQKRCRFYRQRPTDLAMCCCRPKLAGLAVIRREQVAEVGTDFATTPQHCRGYKEAA